MSWRASGLTWLSIASACAVAVSAWLAPNLTLLLALVHVTVLALEIFARSAPEAGPAERFGTATYEMLEKLGEGGMGEVFRAHHVELRRDVAVKQIKPLRSSHEDRQRFEREARALSTLSNPHTINVFDAGIREDGTFFYAMELLDGLDLEKLIQRTGPLPVARTIHILRHAVLSLSEAHAKGFIHRDLKPANLMVCRYGGELDFVKVLDFGLVKRRLPEHDSEPLSLDGSLPGTPAFLAPESIRGSAYVDAKVDIYALGAIAYYLLTGRFLFDELTPMGMVQAQLNDTPPRASVRSPIDVPEALDALIEACLRKKAEERPDTMQLRNLLDQLRHQFPWSREDAETAWKRIPAAQFRAASQPALPSQAGPS